MTSFLTWCVQVLTKVLDPLCEDDSIDPLLPAAAYSLAVKHRQTADEEQPSCMHWGILCQSQTAFCRQPCLHQRLNSLVQTHAVRPAL